MSSLVSELYDVRVAAGEIENDPVQRAVVERLDALCVALEEWRPSRKFFGDFTLRLPNPAPRGVYLHGEVGRGKTMLMNAFFESTAFAPKQRIHFHEFMALVHERIAVARTTAKGDPIPAVARSLADDARLLCFDELTVIDIADAMVLGRLFSELFSAGVVVVTTSNAAPRDLYRDGLNRQLFLPFVDLIERHLDVFEVAAAKDFRLDKLAGKPLYFTPADEAAAAEIDGIWDRLTGRHPPEPVDVVLKGRILPVPVASMGVARCSFAELCERPLGAADYVRLAHTFHTLILEHIPLLEGERRASTRRFVNLIDTLYDANVSLVVSAAAEPDALCTDARSRQHFERTQSRLTEMRTETYLRRAHKETARATEGGPSRIRR